MSNNHFIQEDLVKKLFFNLIKNNQWNTLLELIEYKQVDLNYRDKNGRNALYWAIEFSKTSIIKKLVNMGIDQKVNLNLSAINYAIYKDDVKSLKCLKSCGLNLNEIDDINSTPLIHAVLYNKINCINYLVDNGADIHHEDDLDNSAFSLAYNLKIEYLINKFTKLSEKKLNNIYGNF